MIKIAFVEIRKQNHPVKIMDHDLTLLKRDQPVLAQFPQHAVYMNCRQPHRIGQ